MRVVILSEVFSRDMGYAENVLPRFLAREGAEVHLVTTRLKPYYYDADFNKTYAEFFGEEGVDNVEQADGFTVHYLPHAKALGYTRMVGLRDKLRALNPDVVQTFAAISWIPLEAALASRTLRYSLFTGCHTHASVFPLAKRQTSLWDRQYLKCLLQRSLHGRLVSLLSERCYAITSDCADVATRFFGVEKGKVDLCPLGVDTDLFHPVQSEQDLRARVAIRERFGFVSSDIVCCYTGRFSKDKNPLLLARAIQRLAAAGEPFRGLFIGNGVQEDEIQACTGCVVTPFVPFTELPGYFRAAEIGVWPTQESMSMLDAASCGIPIVVNDTLAETERVLGNGLQYRLNDLNDLCRALLALKEAGVRAELGRHGTEKMARVFGWGAIARRRMDDYHAARGAA